MEPPPTATVPASDSSAVTAASAPRTPNAPDATTLVDIEHLDFFYGQTQALNDINLKIDDQQGDRVHRSFRLRQVDVAALHQPDERPHRGTRVARGTIKIQGGKSTSPRVDVIELRKRVGMVFQKSNPFPKSIYENITYGLRLQGEEATGPSSMRSWRNPCAGAALWDEVKDRLHTSGLGLSGGQQQRLCIARAIAVEPEVILMDEPCSALDPVATAKIEELIQELRTRFTIVIVTHNMQQAARCSDRTAFFYLGRLIEYADTRDIFTNPSNPQTEAYVSGRFG